MLDASVALAVALDEPAGRRATALLSMVLEQPVPVLVPVIFDVECAGGLIKAVRRGRLAASRCLDTLLGLLALPVERVDSPAALVTAAAIALERGISAYDALYVGLATERGLPLLTADARLERALAGGPCAIVHPDEV